MNDTPAKGPRYGVVDVEYAKKLATTEPDRDGPVWMVNLMHYRESADYQDGQESQISGRQADDIYSPVDVLAKIGAELVFIAEVEEQLLGKDPLWDRVAIVKYPTRKSFIEMQQREDFQEKHVHKEAGMKSTIVMGGLPTPLPEMEGVSSVDPDQVPHPATEEDGEIVVLHVLKYEESVDLVQNPEDMNKYSSEAAKVAAQHGVSVSGFFAVEGTILGDGRDWDQIRFINYPSKRAFMAVVSDPDRLKAQVHRENAISDTYTLILRPTLNRLKESLEN